MSLRIYCQSVVKAPFLGEESLRTAGPCSAGFRGAPWHVCPRAALPQARLLGRVAEAVHCLSSRAAGYDSREVFGVRRTVP